MVTDPVLGSIRPVTRYAYDTLGNLIEVWAGRTDAAGTNPGSDVATKQVTNAYDDFGRKIKETDALGRIWRFEYDTYGNLTKRTDPKGQYVSWTYTYGGRVATQNAYQSAGSSSSHTVTTTRNPLGQPTRVAAPEVIATYTYDAAHRVKTVTDSRGAKTQTYEWSPGGQLKSLINGEGQKTSYAYDPVGRLTAIWAPSGEQVTFAYDPGGRLTEKWLPNGVTTRYAYNADNTLLQVVNRSKAAAIITQHDYTYDPFGNRLTHAEKIGATTTPYRYLYDELDRLTEVRNNTTGATLESYTYDPLGNRLTKTAGTDTLYYVYDAANQLKEVRQTNAAGALLATLGYDPNGNLTTKTEGATTTTLTYNAFDRLTQAAKTGLPAETYTYDPAGNRIQKQVGTGVTRYLYAGPDIIAEYPSASWATPTATTTHGPNLDDPLLRVAGAATIYYHQDGLGSVVAATDKLAATVGTGRYDAWGVTIAQTGAIPQYGYTGREPDATGLVYYRARYYDPGLARFTQRDPLGLVAGINRYAYVMNNPVNRVDPLGLMAQVYLPGREPTRYPSDIATLAAGPSQGQYSNTSYDFAPLDCLQIGLDVAGLVPGLGEIADGVNAVISLVRGDYTGAGLSAAAMVPFAGWAATAAKGVDRAADAVKTAQHAARGAGEIAEGTKVYRVWGGKSGPWGESWTTVNPNTVPGFRSAAGLPDVNTGRFVSEGVLKSTEGVTSRGALVIKPGQQGGLPELLIKDAELKVLLQRVSGINPEF